VKRHLLSKGRNPSLAELAYTFTTDPKVVTSWISSTKARAKKLSKKKRSSFSSALESLEAPRPEPFSQRDLRIPKGVTFFASGAERSAGDIEGISRIADRHHGIGIGIDVSGCGEDCREALNHVAAKGRTPLFVDSGAFSEARPGVAITDDEWGSRLEAYNSLSRKFKSRANLVAPDMIGSQKGTAARLKRFGALMAQPSHRGSWILLAAQGGRQRRYVFWEDMRGLLARQGVVPGKIVAALPLKEKGLTLEEVASFAARYGDRYGGGISRYHLLGRGPLHPLFRKTLAAIWKSSSSEITCDASTLVAGIRGKPELLGVVPKAYVYAQDIVRYELMFDAFQKSYQGAGSIENWVSGEGWQQEDVPDYTDNISRIGWLPPRYRRVLANWLEVREKQGGPGEFGRASRNLLLEEPSEWIQSSMYRHDPGGPKWYDDEEVAAWLDDQWQRFLGNYYSATVKRDALAKAWSASRDAAITELAFK